MGRLAQVSRSTRLYERSTAALDVDFREGKRLTDSSSASSRHLIPRRSTDSAAAASCPSAGVHRHCVVLPGFALRGGP
jgi:hypothetical protein